MATRLITDERDDLDRASDDEQHILDDNDGHFAGREHDYVKLIESKLTHARTRQWTYVMDVAVRARLVKQPKKKKGPEAELDPRLTDAELRVLLALVRRASKDLSNSYPGLKSVADACGFHPRILRRLLRSLVKKGWIRRDVSNHLYGTVVNQFCVPAGVLAKWHAGWECPVVWKRRRGDPHPE